MIATAKASRKASSPHDNPDPTGYPLHTLLGSDTSESEIEQEQEQEQLDIVAFPPSEKHPGDEAYSPPQLPAALANIVRIGLHSEKQV